MDVNLRVVAFEVISRHEGDARMLQTDAPGAIINAFLHTGMNDLFHRLPVFVSTTPEFLLSELPLLLPEKRIVFQLEAQQDYPEGYVDRISALSALGYGMAINDFMPDDLWQALLPYARYVKIDITRPARLSLLNASRSRRIACIATKVDTPEWLDQARNMNFSFYQGSFFSKPKEQCQKSVDSIQDILDLITKLNNDGSDRIIENFFKLHPTLAIHLLHLVNCGSSGFTKEIDSIRQVLSLLGRTQLLRWFQLLLYSVDDRYASPNPLMAAAAWRGRFMELMVRYSQRAPGSHLQDQAYMVGMLSMVDALLDEPLAEILPNLHLSRDISNAALERSGVLGQLLRLAEALQFEEFVIVETLAREQNYNIDTIMHLQNEAMAWVQQFHHRTSDAKPNETHLRMGQQ